ncbi:MAG: hypothetical protein VX588_05410 [Verrucomicrobiota bacterium]|nr:hypothetical protein [Verrucomicrobiota bacterium]
MDTFWKLVKLGTIFLATLMNVSGKEPAFIKDIDITSRLLAGISVPEEKDITSSENWKKHQQLMTKAWSRYKKNKLVPMRSGSEKNLSTQNQGKYIKYPFSGPDILHALYIFPEATNFILCGLEPVGKFPKSDILRGGNSNQALEEIRKILEESLRFSFFKTIDMRAELSKSFYNGTLPIMCLFLSGSGFSIRDIDFIKLNKDGTISELQGNHSTGDAVQIRAVHENGREVLVNYFRTNISNGLILKSGFLKYLESIPKGESYVKAASYLMHKSYFSQIRNHLLSNSTTIIQDDSGIPIKHFNQSSWQMKYFGTYTKPIDLFEDHYQPNLREIYKQESQKLPFGTGYRWRKGQSNLIVAEQLKKGKAPRATLVVKKVIPKKEKKKTAQISKGKSLDLNLRLIAKSVITKEYMNDKKNALVLNEYVIIGNNEGNQGLSGQKILVARTGLFKGKKMPEHSIGSIFSVKLDPLSDYPSLMEWPIKNDLPKSENKIIYIPSQS